MRELIICREGKFLNSIEHKSFWEILFTPLSVVKDTRLSWTSDWKEIVAIARHCEIFLLWAIFQVLQIEIDTTQNFMPRLIVMMLCWCLSMWRWVYYFDTLLRRYMWHIWGFPFICMPHFHLHHHRIHEYLFTFQQFD